MTDFSADNSQTPSGSGSTITRAMTGLSDRTAQPPLMSGFGAVLEKEQELQAATERSVGHFVGQHSSDLDRILREQHARLSANIALLEQRYEALPKPERFQPWHERHHPPAAARCVVPEGQDRLLPNLIARHMSLLSDIEALIRCAPDGQRGELILAEVGRNHEEMAWMLTALLKEDLTATRLGTVASPARRSDTARAEERWDNEGGTPAPPASG